MNWGYIILAYLSLFALGLSDNSRGPLFAEIIKSFSVSDTQGAFYFAISSFLGFVGSYLVRFLIHRFQRIPSLQIGLLLMTFGLVGMGLAPSFTWMLVASAVLGASIGIVGVVQNVLVTVGSTPQRRQRLLAGLHAFYAASSLLAPLAAAGLTKILGAWPWVFCILAVVPAAVFIGGFFNKTPEIKMQPSAPAVATAGGVPHRAQIYVGLAFGFYVLAEIMMSSRLALFVRREMQMDLAESSYYLTGFFVCMLAGRTLFALVHFPWPLRKMLSASLILSILSFSLGLAVSPVFLVLTGLFMAPFYPLAVAYIFSHFESSVSSAVSSSMAIQSFLTVLMHAGVGYLTDLYGIGHALWAGPVSLLFSFLLLNSFETIFRKRV